jgi:hypothetical protein
MAGHGQTVAGRPILKGAIDAGSRAHRMAGPNA